MSAIHKNMIAQSAQSEKEEDAGKKHVLVNAGESDSKDASKRRKAKGKSKETKEAGKSGKTERAKELSEGRKRESEKHAE